MIKFFRKIRQQLLSENKFSKYMIYAIGEIFLVVIGILIAVQINDWNEESKIAKSSKIHLEKMIIELENTKDRMEYLSTNKSGKYSFGYACLNDAVNACDSLLKMSYSGFTEAEIPYIVSAPFMAGASSLNIQQDVFEEVKNAGGLNSLGSKELVTAIRSYNTRIIRESGYADKMNDEKTASITVLSTGLGKLLQDHTLDSLHFDIRDYTWFFESKSREYQDMQTSLNKIKKLQSENMEKMKLISELSDELILMIKAEIK